MEIKDVPTERFNRMLEWLATNQWQCIYNYDGMDAWIDYGEVHFSKAGVVVKCVWDNWTEGEISAPVEIQELRELI